MHHVLPKLPEVPTNSVIDAATDLVCNKSHLKSSKLPEVPTNSVINAVIDSACNESHLKSSELPEVPTTSAINVDSESASNESHLKSNKVIFTHKQEVDKIMTIVKTKPIASDNSKRNSHIKCKSISVCDLY